MPSSSKDFLTFYDKNGVAQSSLSCCRSTDEGYASTSGRLSSELPPYLLIARSVMSWNDHRGYV
jgi:hypothetical protein